MNEAPVFKLSQATLGERRSLLRGLRLGLALALLLACLALGKVWAWAAALPALALIWRFKAERLLQAFPSRELRVQDNALEIISGKFTRLLFFSQLEQLRMIQGPGEKVLALELRTLEGAVILHGYENMEALFSAVNARKPARVLIEVEEARYDTLSIAFWSRLVLLLGAGLMALWLGIALFR